jgi:hypothetical protein
MADQPTSAERRSTEEGTVADHAERAAETEAEIERQASHIEEDEITSREDLEEELMDEGRSEDGEEIP